MAEAFPIIDIAALLQPKASRQQRAGIAAQIDAACRTTGFFGVRGHGVSPACIRALYRAAYAFFDLPLDEKLKVARPKPEQNRGYIAYGNETLARLAGRETPPTSRNCSRSDHSICRMSRISLARPPIQAWPPIYGRSTLRNWLRP